MTATTATVMPNFEHGKIVIAMTCIDSQAWPTEAVAVSGTLPIAWLRDNWKPQAGQEWKRIDDRHAVVTQ